MISSAKYFAIVPAAGKSTRMGSAVAKPYLTLRDKKVIEHSLSPLLSNKNIEKILVVIQPEDQEWQKLSIHQHPKIATVLGGEQRYHSVLNGLQALESVAQENDWVLVHDAARPCFNVKDLDKLIAELSTHPTGGALGVKISDTVKRVTSSNEVVATVDRSELWQAYTPQMFRFALLKNALEKIIEKNLPVTDEAQAIELSGASLKMVAGSRNNIKITYPEDLKLAELFLR